VKIWSISHFEEKSVDGKKERYLHFGGTRRRHGDAQEMRKIDYIRT